MPMVIEHIDAIARQKQRDVLFVAFHRSAPATVDVEEILDDSRLEWETLPVRQQIIDWLDAQGIGWAPCGHFADMGLMMGYQGQLYIDVPYDRALPAYQAVQALLEFPDGRMQFPDATFYCCSLDQAMTNATHDEPGFWERWANNF